ncbi:hypothetical protein [Oscillibacter sp.]|uniref:hypothetical protein n=1 Tax=Oscillibacter sp. TaxID=1945593 RepID=UPI00289A3405|nr:hypothetical protein [Oscillibacter sp.]
MAELKFETGIVTFTVNGGYEISFNPTDTAFVKKLFDAFETLDKRQDGYKAEVEKNANKREVFDVAQRMDGEMREIIDGVFGDPVCDGIFGGMNVYALADGLPVWCNFMLAVMDEVDTTFSREQKATNPRISKYTAKYHK